MCILAGKILVVTEVDDNLISEDSRFKDLFLKSADFLVKQDPIKIFVSSYKLGYILIFWYPAVDQVI